MNILANILPVLMMIVDFVLVALIVYDLSLFAIWLRRELSSTKNMSEEHRQAFREHGRKIGKMMMGKYGKEFYSTIAKKRWRIEREKRLNEK